MHYIRIGMFSVKTPHGTPLRFITSIRTKQQWLTLDHWACPLNNSPKDSSELEKTTGWKKTEWNNNKCYLWPLFMGQVENSETSEILF